MVSVEQLSSLDCLMWLQAGQSVAQTIAQHQTTVSRHQRRCADVFAIQVGKSQGEWRISGDTELLQLEREVHQAARLRDQRRLRLEAHRQEGSKLNLALPPGWLIGSSRIQRTQHLTQLLKDRILDAWLIHPQQERPTDAAIELIPLSGKPGLSCLAIHADLQRLEPVASLARRLAVHASGVASGSTSPINHQLKP
ncbi:hypothetical protein [Parasynechococcus sp.]|uniref:hypothetical protein n=1 Tax=Parasynechococcus sp. TaxID=3101203 RepID=UPI003704515C